MSDFTRSAGLEYVLAPMASSNRTLLQILQKEITDTLDILSRNGTEIPGDGETLNDSLSLDMDSYDADMFEYIFDNPRLQYSFIVLYSVVFFFCFFGNLTVLLVMTFHWKMRSITKFCLGNLAFANLCVGVFCIYQNLSMYLIDSWIFGNFMCKMYHFTNNLSHTASILILVMISVERYLVIVHPFKCRSIITMRRLKILILGIWTASAILCAPRLFYIDIVRNRIPGTGGKQHETICVLLSNIYDSHTADIIQFFLLFLLPLTVITILYAKVGLQLRRRTVTGNSLVNPSICRRSVEESSRGGGGGGGSPRLSSASMRIMRNSSDNHHHPRRSCTPALSLEEEDSRSRKSRRSFAARSLNRGNNYHHRDCREEMMRMSRTLSVTSRPLYKCRSHVPAVRMLIVHVITFALCNLPFHLRKLYQNFIFQLDVTGYFFELATPLSFLLMYTNCAINPIVYAFMSSGFRSCLVELVTCKVGKKKTGSRA